MVAIYNSVQLLCRRTCETLQVYHWQWQPYTIGTGEGDYSAFQAFFVWLTVNTGPQLVLVIQVLICPFHYRGMPAFEEVVSSTLKEGLGFGLIYSY